MYKINMFEKNTSKNAKHWHQLTKDVLKKDVKYLSIRTENWKKVYSIIGKALQYDAPIAYAASKNSDSAIRVLIEAGYNPLVPIFRVGDALTIALRDKYTLVVKELLSYDNIYTSDRYNELLIDAIFYSASPDIIKLLLDDDRIDVTAQDNAAIVTASKTKQWKTVELLMGNGANPGSENNTPIIEASADGKLHIVELLLEDNRVNPSARDNAAIIKASAGGHYDVVKLLLKDNRVDPSDQNNTALIKASTEKHYDIVKLLLKDERTNPNARFGIAILEAIRNSSYEMVDILINDYRTDLSVGYNDIIITAASSGNVKLIEKLLADNNVDPSAQYNKAILNAYISYRHAKMDEFRPSDQHGTGHVNNTRKIVFLLLNSSLVNPWFSDLNEEFYQDKEIEPVLRNRISNVLSGLIVGSGLDITDYFPANGRKNDIIKFVVGN